MYRERRGELGLPPLPDLLGPGLRLIFVGFNPGERSARTGHYYAGRNNRFWWLLHQAGLTDRQLRPEEDHLLPTRYRIGATDIVKRPSRSSGDLAGWEFAGGRAELLDKLARCRPQVVCYNGKGVYAAAAGVRQVAYGLQAGQLVPGVIDFVAASPSGRSREPIQLKLALYRQVAELLASG